MEDIPTILNHISIGVRDLDAAAAFYTRVLETIGARQVMTHPGAVAFGKQFPEFWVQTPIDGQPASVGNGTHVGFFARSRDEVDAFYRVALEAGATGDGPPGERPEYGPPYYGCFVRDPEGHKIEATYWDMAKM